MKLTSKARLELWAERLDREPQRCLSTLGEIELASPSERPCMRSDNSPLTVAFEDPVLRAIGLKSDNFGDAVSFFDLTEGDAHYILCSCMNGSTMTAAQAAQRVRSITNRTTELRVLLSCLVGALAVLGIKMLLG
ncbi:hypothetical protein [Microvirga arabica]|uniref:hypothetical protein n=1 Tax=Microvirga arabica TaxID=1128671 RepID=UPI00193A8A21|nr:hypothetical protein [Microvirga arabica]MBM1170008.1 hypothetical protein [Microvirga arabica]